MRRLPTHALFTILMLFVVAGPALAQPPLAVVREAWLRGTHVRVVDLGGGLLRTELDNGSPVAQVGTLAHFDTRPFTTGAPAPDPIAAGQAWKVRVSAPGMQTLGADSLAAAGLTAGQFDPTMLHLRHRGQEVALEEQRDPGGALVGLRFFAEPGDRWNADAVYWLTKGTEPGLRMASVNATPTAVPLAITTTASERGIWRSNTVYDTRWPGPDGDHFFSADLAAALPGATPAFVTATLALRLPAAGSASLTLRGETADSGTFQLCVRAGPPPATSGYAPCTDPAQPERLVSWSGQGTWTQNVSLPATDPPPTLVTLTNLSQQRVWIESLAWELPVRLDLATQGARFTGRAEPTRYQLANQPPDAAVYDLADPLRPVRLRFSGDTFETSGTEAHQYLVTGAGTLQRPTISTHTPVDLSTPLNVEALYIAPAAFVEALGPLLAHRRAQGLSVAVATTEAIYDTWGYGEVSPDAIRNFLRYAAERWAVAPTSVTLVGDGSSDPRNYLGRNNITWVPPYLVPVDPWLGETACEACYAQLQGASPLDDALPDLAFGRIPAKSALEAAALVTKILAYENDHSLGVWRTVVAYIADNTDFGGNFTAALEASAAMQPATIRVSRLIYDPEASADDPQREADPLRALDRTMNSFNQGAAIINYIGHGVQFQWGYTGPPLQPSQPTDRQYLLGVFRVDELTNGAYLPVVLSMSCLTASFQTPAYSGTSIDERLVARADGGAIAAWGSTGLGVLYGHDALQAGFYHALWAAPGRAALGELTMAGYLELFATKRCCQEETRTFALLGDPLTRPQVRADLHLTNLPLVRR